MILQERNKKLAEIIIKHCTDNGMAVESTMGLWNELVKMFSKFEGMEKQVAEARIGFKPIRMWINQPSEIQQFHKYHGKNVLALLPTDFVKREKRYDWVNVYFTNGDVISMDMSTQALSLGWV